MGVNILTALIIKAIECLGDKHVKQLEKNCQNANKVSEKFLLKLVNDNKNTEYGKKYHFDQIKTIDDYKRLVPLSNYDSYAPYIERMTNNGEKNLLTSYKIIQYAETSGSVGVPKRIPVTDKSMKIYQKYTITRVTSLANKYHKKKYGKGLPIGRGFNQLEIVDRKLPDGTPLGNISGSASKGYKSLFPYYLTSPIPVLYPKGYMQTMYLKLRYALADENTTFMFSVFMSALVDMMVYCQNNWQILVDDIRNGTINDEVEIDDDVKAELLKKTKPDSKRADFLEKEFKKGFDTPIIPRIWPKMSFISTIGTGGFAAYTERMRAFCGDVPIDFSIYGASEAMMAACTDIESPEFALLVDSCFFEFVPADAPEDETNTLNIDQLEVGKDYELILTNLSGFYRYRIKDVVTVLRYQGECPKIIFAYRKSQLLNLVGDKITEAMMDKTMKNFSNEVNNRVLDYVVYPNRDLNPPRYEFIIEPEKPLDINKVSEYRDILEKCLSDVNPIFKEVLDVGSMGRLTLKLQQPQTHALWREMKMMQGTSINQVKPVRVLDNPKKISFFTKMVEE